MFSRRDALAISAAGAVMTASAASAASFGNPDQLAQGAINARGPGNLRDPGPQSRRSATNSLRRNFRRQPMSAACRWTPRRRLLWQASSPASPETQWCPYPDVVPTLPLKTL
jgi:hypothetical protein